MHDGDNPRYVAKFQSTLPARGATTVRISADAYTRLFQSTLPARGATRSYKGFSPDERISIHAPRTGSDARLIPCTPATWNFNPRSPHGERPLWNG